MIEEIIIYPFKNLFRKKGRSLLTVLGVAIGVCSVIIINSIGSYGTYAVNNELDSLGMGGLTVAAQASDIPLGESELEAIKGLDGVKSATPVYMEASKAVSGFGKSENAIVWGIDSNAKNIVALQPMYGREINKSDIRNNSNICMVDRAFAKQMYGKENVVGHNLTVTLQGNTEQLTIVGVIKTGSGLLQAAMGSYMPNFIYIPYTTMQCFTGLSNYNQIITKASDGISLASLTDKIERKLSIINGTDKNSYTITNLAQQKESLTKILSIVTAILSAVGAVSLIVAGLSIMTVMLVSVGERKREIGIKKSIGAGRFVIVREFLSEALMLSAAGCILGIAIAYMLVFAAAKLINVTIMIDTLTIAVTCMFSIASGVVFGVYPALKAARLRPAETLRAL